MNHNPPFDRVLADCLEAMIMEGRSIRALVDNYPQYQTELAELLTVAKTAHKVHRLQPSRIMNEPTGYQVLPSKRTKQTNSSNMIYWLMLLLEQIQPNLTPKPALVAWAVIGALMVALVTGGGVGVAYAADGASPGDPLYSLDQAMEAFQLGMTTEAQAKAELALQLAEERLREMETLADRSATGLAISHAASAYQAQMQRAAEAVAEVKDQRGGSSAGWLQNQLRSQSQRSLTVLNKVAGRAPAAATPAIQSAIAAFQAPVALAPPVTQPSVKSPPSKYSGAPITTEFIPPGLATGTGMVNQSNGRANGASNLEIRLAALEALLQQAQSLAEMGDVQGARIAWVNYENRVHLFAQTLSNLPDEQSRDEALAALINLAQSRHSTVLAHLAEQLPPAAQAGIERALQASSQNNGQGGGPPDDKPGGGPPDDKPGGGPPDDKPGGGPPDTPPGQDKKNE